MISGALALVVAGSLAAFSAQQPQPATPAADTLVVSWDVKPLDLGYNVTISPGASGDQTADYVHLPKNVTRYVWPIRLVVGEHYSPNADSVLLRACVERYRAEVSATEQGGCAEVYHFPSKVPPEIRVEIRKVPR